jgi:carbamoyltransferase
MIAWGINALNHGSSLAVFQNNRYISNRQSTQDILPESFIQHELKNTGKPDRIFWYENPWIKKARQFKAGQYSTAFDMSMLPSRSLKQWGLGGISIAYTQHHASHAAAGYYTSPFNHCAVVVLDAIGEFECATIWEGQHGEMTKVWSRSYPNSLGLFYSAFTHAIGMTPIRDEWKLQQMAENGNPKFFYYRVKKYFTGLLELNYNFHKGVNDQKFYIDSIEDECNLAAAVQLVFEEQIELIMNKAKELTGSDCLVYMGGCAMNSKANKTVVESKFKYIWSLPNPGDPSSSIGAVLYHIKQRVRDIDLGVVKHIEIRV